MRLEQERYTLILNIYEQKTINTIVDIYVIGDIMNTMTTIAVSKNTKESLKRFGSKDETYDDIIQVICETYEDFLDKQYKRLGEKFVELK